MALNIPAEDRLAIQDLLARYAWALDTGDDEAYAQLFTPASLSSEASPSQAAMPLLLTCAS